MGRLSSFILEPLVTHDDKDELYIAIFSKMEQDIILFYEQGGVEVGDIDAKVNFLFHFFMLCFNWYFLKAHKLIVPVQLKDTEMTLPADQLAGLVANIDAKKRE